jgi:hypothetical protein
MEPEVDESRRSHGAKNSTPGREREPAFCRPVQISDVNRAAFLAALLAATVAAAQTAGSELERAHAEVVAAQLALDQALQQRARDEAPRPEERAGSPDDALQGRLREGYFERMRGLEREVALARWRLDQALARWNRLQQLQASDAR